MSTQTELHDYERESLDERIAQADQPWQDERILEVLYHDLELSQAEIADRLGCDPKTISNHLRDNDIPTRRRGRRRVERASYSITPGGYPQWIAYEDGGTTVGVYVHQLLAIADGAEPEEVFADGTHVHHRGGDPVLNIPGLLDVVSPREHRRTHTENEWTITDDGFPVLVQPSNGGDNR